ncbi:MAG: HPr kinase/phosphatase C-terminal domain-containing protein [Pseudomonadota bacterium]|nr:HPr kinase/phosphatase C-terminal domain-containing protein [Pseudomonadota bacterium]
MAAPADTIHATTVAIDGRGVLLCGASGAGKSDLALRLLDEGALLVADDRTILSRHGNALLATVPDALAGLLEVRGLGVVRLDPVRVVPSATIALVVDLVADRAAIRRMPEPASVDLRGLVLPLLTLYPFEPSATARLRLALTLCSHPERRIE